MKHSGEQNIDPEKIQNNRNLQIVTNTNLPQRWIRLEVLMLLISKINFSSEQKSVDMKAHCMFQFTFFLSYIIL